MRHLRLRFRCRLLKERHGIETNRIIRGALRRVLD